MAGILGCFCLIDAGQFAVRDGDAAVDHGVIHRGAQADRAEDVFGIIARADELEPPRIDEESLPNQVRQFCSQRFYFHQG